MLPGVPGHVKYSRAGRVLARRGLMVEIGIRITWNRREGFQGDGTVGIPLLEQMEHMDVTTSSADRAGDEAMYNLRGDQVDVSF